MIKSEYDAEGKEKIEGWIKSEIDSLDTKSPRELLRWVHDSVYHLNSSDTVKLMRTQARFATLLVKLSEQADRQFELSMKIQKTMICLTKALLWVTAVLLVVAFVQIALMLCQH
jgi:hypothetical protein